MSRQSFTSRWQPFVAGAVAVIVLVTAFPGAVRWVTVTASLASVTLHAASMTRRWLLMAPRIRRIGSAFGFLLLVGAYASAEAASAHSPIRSGSYLTCTAMTLVLGALLWKFDEDVRPT